MTVTVGGSPITPTQADQLLAALGLDPAPVTTVKPTPVGADRVVLLDSAAGFAPVLATLATLPGGGGAGALVTVTHNGGGANPVAGDTVTASFAAGYSGTVQWTRNGANIAGATSTTYLLTGADSGTTVAAVVTSLVYTATGLPVGSAPTAPAAFTAGQWTAEATVTAGEIGINIVTLPSNGGSAITALEYRVGTGAAIALSGTGTGLRVVTAGFSAGVAADIQVRAVNAVGAGAWSDTKNRTPLAGGGSFAAAYVSHAINGTEFQNPKVFTGLSIGAADATRKIYVYLYARGPALADALTLSVNGGAALTPIASERTGNNSRQVLVFVADVPTGTTANFSFSSAGNDFNNCGIALIRAVGAHSAATSSAVNFGSLSASINTVAGDRIFIGAMFQGDAGAGFFGSPAGFTEHMDEPTRPSIPAQPALLCSGTAAGGTPETFTGTVGDSAGTSEILLRLRAA